MLKSKSKTNSQKIREHASELADMITPHVESAREKAAPVIAEAREKAAPVIADAREKAAPAIDTARTKFSTEVLPVITAAVAAASEATEDAREEAFKRGKATAAALKGEVEAPVQKKHRLRKVLILLGLAGIAAVVAKTLSDRQASTAWKSSYAPEPPAPAAPVDETPTATAAAAAAAARADDEGGSGPDEAAADAAETPHPATTPDNPADEVKLDRD